MGAEPFFRYVGIVLEANIKTASAGWLGEIDVEIGCQLRTPSLFAVVLTSEEIISPHARGNQLLEHIAPEQISDPVRRIKGVETFL